MNWKQLNETCPLAFREWVRIILEQGDNITIDFKTFASGKEYCVIGSFEDGELPVVLGENDLLRLPIYFDSLGIYVDTERYNFYFATTVCGNVGPIIFWQGYPTRLSALEAGIIKAFEIREEQILKLKQ